MAVAAEAPAELPPVSVSGLPAARAELQTPAAVSQIDRTSLGWGQPQINLSESAAEVPGLSVRNRYNYAQDLQIQSRGFGARSTFGVRGLQLRLDGIPLTAPDGQGAPSSLLLSSLDRVEVLRGPLAYLYGNASGGAIAAFSAPFPEQTEFTGQWLAGADHTWRGGLSVGGQALDTRLGYRVEAARFLTQGEREHSAARRHQFSAGAQYRLDETSRLSVRLATLSQPQAQDPLGLTRAQYQSNPQQADAAATQFNTRKSLNERLAGLRYEREVDGRRLELNVYGSARAVEQFQSIPVAVQSAPTHAGGVINLQRDSRGAELRYILPFGALQISAGLQGQALNEARRGYENFQGSTLGVRGNLRRDEANRVQNVDQFLLAEWALAPRWSLAGALRRSEVRFVSEDRYVTASNPDDSGRLDYRASTPALALRHEPDALTLLYASWGRGFETPTFNELSYRPDGGSGLNFALRDARSETLELGWKRALGARGMFTATLFHVDGEREIVPAVSSGGRASFQNAPGTRRRGAEASLRLPLPAQTSVLLSADYLDAEFSEAYRYTAGGNTNTVDAGHRIPGVARSNAYVELAWRRGQPGWSAALDLRHSGAVAVNDLNSDAAESYRVANLRLVRQQPTDWGRVSGFVRADNIFDQRYAGSVIVNEANGRYFEPAPGRGWFAGIEFSFEPARP